MTNLSPKPRDIDAAYKDAYTAARKHMQHTSRHRHTKKTLPDALSSPTTGDFVLFPNNERKKPRTPESTKTKQCATNDSPNSLSRHTDLAATTRLNEKNSPRSRTPRHGGFKIVDLSSERNDNDDSDCKRRETKPPPAPRPPILDSPDLTDDDDDDDAETFWACNRRPSSPKMGTQGVAA